MENQKRSLNDWVQICHQMSRDKGWYDGEEDRNVPEMLALVHSEVSEMLEEYRDGKMTPYVSNGVKPEGFAAEAADVIIRMFDLAGYLKIDLDEAVRTKVAYNATRPHRHGGKKC